MHSSSPAPTGLDAALLGAPGEPVEDLEDAPAVLAERRARRRHTVELVAQNVLAANRVPGEPTEASVLRLRKMLYEAQPPADRTGTPGFVPARREVAQIAASRLLADNGVQAEPTEISVLYLWRTL